VQLNWYNTERLHSACKYIPPKEYEENYCAQQAKNGNLIVYGK
jgi:transposase InsO family protein